MRSIAHIVLLMGGMATAGGDIACAGDLLLPPVAGKWNRRDTVGVVLFKGKLGLLNHSPFRGVQNLQVDSGVTGTKSGRPFVVLSYADSARSQSMYRQWVKEMITDGSAVVQKTEREAHIRDRDGETLTISLTATHIVGVRGIDASDIIRAIAP